MAQLYFHCSSARVVDIDQCGTDLDDLIEARDHAAQVVRSLVTTPASKIGANWVLHVSDELGEEVFIMPFSALLGRTALTEGRHVAEARVGKAGLLLRTVP